MGVFLKVAESLSALEIRHLLATDKGFTETLSSLSPVSLSQEEISAILRERTRNNIHTIVGLLDNKVVVTASYFIETKFLHNGGAVMHIEDVATHKDYRGKGLGQAIMDYLCDESEKAACYKIILDCSEDNVHFYEKCGYRRHEIEMRMDLNANVV